MRVNFSVTEVMREVGENYAIVRGETLRFPVVDGRGLHFLTTVVPMELSMNQYGDPLLTYLSDLESMEDYWLPELQEMVKIIGLDLGRYPSTSSLDFNFGIYVDDPDRESGPAGEADWISTNPKQASHVVVTIWYDAEHSPYTAAEAAELGAERLHTSWGEDPSCMTLDTWIFPLQSSRYPDFWALRWRLGKELDQGIKQAEPAVREIIAHREEVKAQFEQLAQAFSDAGWAMRPDLNSVDIEHSDPADGSTNQPFVYVISFNYTQEDLELCRNILRHCAESELSALIENLMHLRRDNNTNPVKARRVRRPRIDYLVPCDQPR